MTEKKALFANLQHKIAQEENVDLSKYKYIVNKQNKIPDVDIEVFEEAKESIEVAEIDETATEDVEEPTQKSIGKLPSNVQRIYNSKQQTLFEEKGIENNWNNIGNYKLGEDKFIKDIRYSQKIQHEISEGCLKSRGNKDGESILNFIRFIHPKVEGVQILEAIDKYYPCKSIDDAYSFFNNDDNNFYISAYSKIIYAMSENINSNKNRVNNDMAEIDNLVNEIIGEDIKTKNDYIYLDNIFREIQTKDNKIFSQSIISSATLSHAICKDIIEKNYNNKRQTSDVIKTIYNNTGYILSLTGIKQDQYTENALHEYLGQDYLKSLRTNPIDTVELYDSHTKYISSNTSANMNYKNNYINQDNNLNEDNLIKENKTDYILNLLSQIKYFIIRIINNISEFFKDIFSDIPEEQKNYYNFTYEVISKVEPYQVNDINKLEQTNQVSNSPDALNPFEENTNCVDDGNKSFTKKTELNSKVNNIDKVIHPKQESQKDDINLISSDKIYDERKIKCKKKCLEILSNINKKIDDFADNIISDEIVNNKVANKMFGNFEKDKANSKLSETGHYQVDSNINNKRQK